MAVVALLFLRVILPIALGVCACFRRTFLSFAYFILLVISPLIKLPTSGRRGQTQGFLLVVILISGLVLFGKAVFHVALAASPPYGHMLINCEALETLLRHFGFLKLDNVGVLAVVRAVVPDVVVLVCSLLTYITVRVKSVEDWEDDEEPDIFTAFSYYFTYVGEYVSLLLLVCAAAIQPSIPGAFYFLVFLGAMNWWACNKRFGPGFAYTLFVAKWVMVIQLCAIFVVQWQYVQDAVQDIDNLYFRLFGLRVLVTSDCDNPQEDHFLYADWDYYVNPFLLMISFNVLAITARLVLDAHSRKTLEEEQQKRTGLVAISIDEDIAQDGLQPVAGEEQPPDEEGRGGQRPAEVVPEEDAHSQHIHFVDVIDALKQLFIQDAYVVASIAMMAWSIAYHSWVAFVLLLWACLAWICPPNQHMNMLRSSPFLVVYAQLLLVVQYAYSMDLTDDELPQYVAGFVNMVQVGFMKYPRFPIGHILLKSFFTCTFWIVLHQSKTWQKDKEKFDKRHNPIVDAVGDLVLHAMSKYLIWVAGVLWFCMALVGVRMNVQRALYMALFLLYILNFQITYRLWRRLLYASWIVVVMYSMLVLILIYTFQFDNFPEWWDEYLNVPPHLQLDVGLRQYDSARVLFVRLLPVVAIIAVSVTYLHLYHEHFLAITDPSRIAEFRAIEDETQNLSTAQPQAEADNAETPAGEEKQVEDSNEVALPGETITTDAEEGTFREFLQQKLETVQRYEPAVTLIFWRFMTLYLVKIAVLAVGTMCIYDVCPPHIVLLMLVVLALLFGKMFHLLAIRIAAIGVAVCLMGRTIYQINYFDHSYFDVVCLDADGNDIFAGYHRNDAEWFGLYKITPGTSLASLIKGYIGVIAVLTMLSCAIYRLAYIRAYKHTVTERGYKHVKVMFPEVTRANADDSLQNFIRYLFNYVFYKFGVEICFSMIAILMAVRLDVYAVLHGIWLCFMVFMSRRSLARIWLLFIIFNAAVIPVQYLISIGLPHSLCTVYPWRYSDRLRNVQDWFYLPGSAIVPPSYRYMCDFMLLMFSCHQYYVFLIEAREDERSYDGGSNKDITDQLDDPDFENPIRDFFPVSQSWLDALKRVGSQVLLWVALSLVFFAGVNRINIFSFGYLGLTFFFLSRGRRLYLLPVRTIIRRWDILLVSYNLAVMMIKMVLQIIGCVFLRSIMETACWSIELLGISCFVRANSPLGGGRCNLPQAFAGLWWDVVCFSVLIFTRRFFGSCYFLHLVNETKVMVALADRGAHLFTKYQERRDEREWLREDANFQRILRNMQRITEKQKRLQGPRYKKLLMHYEVIRAGDYYMFEIMDEDDLEEEVIYDKRVLTKQTLGEVLTEAFGVKYPDKVVESTDVATTEDKQILEPKGIRTGITLWWIMKLIWAMAGGMMVSMTIILYGTCTDYLYVYQMLEWKKNTLKANHTFLAGKQDERGGWHPAEPVDEYLKLADDQPEDDDYDTDDPHFWLDESQPSIVLLLSSVYYVLTANSQYLCFFIIFLIQISSASLLSLPLPIMVFVWGVFITPRPGKKFWLIIIIYTKVIIVIKCILQFDFIQMSEETDEGNPFEPTRIIGVQRSKYYVIYELILLLVVYFHRLMLKSMGLWEEHRDVKSTKYSRKSRPGFFKKFLMPSSSVLAPKDVYTYMFICSFVNFLVLMFGFLSFGVEQPDSSLLALVERNRVPLQLLVILLVQFVVIVVDRSIYLSKAVRGRMAMHFLLVVLVHVWLFFVLPATTQRPFNNTAFPQVFYMIQAAYFVFSAYQIRCGFPLRVLGNVLCSDYKVHNYLLFKVYLNIPFLAEIRGIMDWIFMTTSMKILTFLTMESIFYHVFQLKCKKRIVKMLSHAASTQVRTQYKWWLGGIMLLFMFAIIWGPLYVFTIGMAAGTANPPYSFSLTIDAAGHASLYRGLVQSTQIFSLTPEQWDEFKKLYNNDRRASSFLRNYQYNDVAVISISRGSTSVWEASPVDQAEMYYTVTNTSLPLTFTFRWQVSRISKDSQHSGISGQTRTWVLTGDDENREVLSNVLRYNNSVPFPIPRMMPKFLEITNQDTSYPVRFLFPGGVSEEDSYRDVELRLSVDNVTRQDWWEVQEKNCSAPVPELLQQLPHFNPDCRNMLIYTFNEKMLPLSLTKLISGKGVITLYVTSVYVIALFIRSITVTSVGGLMFSEVPTIDRVEQMCRNIYLAREYGELALEEYLYSQLLFLFRSPETLIRWTRYSEPRQDA